MATRWDSSSVAEGLHTIERCRPLLLEDLKRLLNDYHGQTQSTPYYDLILGDWLEHFIHSTYAAWRQALESEQAIVRRPIPVVGTPRSCVTVNSGLHPFLHWAAVRLLNGESPGQWEFSATDCNIDEGAHLGWGRRLAEAVGQHTAPVLVCAPYFKCTRVDWGRAVVRWRRMVRWNDLSEPIRISGRLDQRWRRDRASSAGPVIDFFGLLCAILPLLLPVAFLESFAKLRHDVLTLPIRRPRVAYTANALNGHLVFKVLTAEWRQAGTLLLNHQHGGGYGLDRVHVLEDFEKRVADRFYSWGWVTDDPRVIPLTSAPPPIYDLAGPGRRKVLLCCVDFPLVVYRLHFHPMPGTIETMHRETVSFVRGLANRRPLVIRPYSQDYGSGFLDTLRREAADATIDESGNRQFRKYAESSVVVHNYLGTSWLETLALDIPTVCFFDPNTYAFRTAAQPYVDDLERVGVLHRNGDEAARFVNRLGDDVDGWWRGADVQAARGAFVARYANFSPDWQRQWEAEFTRQMEATL
jgi:putative transferase (TIGR04331 family)